MAISMKVAVLGPADKKLTAGVTRMVRTATDFGQQFRTPQHRATLVCLNLKRIKMN
jgi:hypothetical protein